MNSGSPFEQDVTGREGNDAEKDLKESQTSIDWFCPPVVVRLSSSFWFRRRVSLRARGEQRRRGGDRNGTAAEKLRQFVFQATYIVDNPIPHHDTRAAAL